MYSMSSMYRTCRFCQRLTQINTITQRRQRRLFSKGSTILARTISLYPNISVHDLAHKLKKKNKQILELLEEYGCDIDHGVNTSLDIDIAEAIADEFGFKTEQENVNTTKVDENVGVMLPRPPVITIMGHVDHGKTTLLDYLRNTQVADGEAGGITQNITAFSVKVPGLSDSITFIDTPGHAAFSNMRERGAQTTDAVVLIIAADDGIMNQTVECIKHIKKAGAPLIVAFNKIDKPKNNSEKIKKDLLTHGIQLKDLGGDIESVEISALKGTNVDQLLVLLNNLAKKHSFKASYDSPAQVVVIEAENNKQKGITSTVLLKHGHLSKGKVLLSDTGFAKIRQMFDSYGKVIEKANPSEPVTFTGWRAMPKPGDIAIEVANEAEARSMLKAQAQKGKPQKIVQQPPTRKTGKKQLTQDMKGGRNKRIPLRVTLRADAASGKVQAVEKAETVDIIIKADVSGSLEAIVNILNSFHSQDLTLNVLHAGVGTVTKSDLKMLQSSEVGIIYGFNIGITKQISTLAGKMNIDVQSFDIIYKLLDDLKGRLEDILPMNTEEVVVGEAEVLKVFKLTGSRKSIAAGCRVKDGFLDNSDPSYRWRVIRHHEVVCDVTIKSLKRGKEDIVLAKKMTECGVTLDGYEDYKEGDKILCVRIDKTKQIVEWNL